MERPRPLEYAKPARHRRETWEDRIIKPFLIVLLVLVLLAVAADVMVWWLFSGMLPH